jgi:hypothetical protein
MGKVYVGQTKLTIKLDTGSTLTNVTTALIKYIKPDRSTGQFTATVDDKEIYYDIVSVSDIDAAGIWSFYAHITYNDGKIIIGEKSTITVYSQGE